jgi:hypothetical protein
MAFQSPTEDIEKQSPSDGEADSLTAGTGGVKAGQVVKITGDSKGEPSDTDGEVTHHVSAQSVAEGDEFMALGNSAKVLYTAGESISAGDPLTSHGGTGEEGQVATASATGDYIIGYAKESAGAQGDTFVGYVNRGGQVN